ncbi:unnamed protein product, partial [Lymnaea stagnalis]
VGVENLKIGVEIDKSLKTLTRGLLGNFNGNPYDDFQLPNGTVLSPNLTEEQVFNLFASSYRVNEVNSIFIYDAGKSCGDYQHPEFIPTFRSSFTTTQINEAAELCGLSSEDCIFDLIATGNETIALNTKFLTEEHNFKIENLVHFQPENGQKANFSTRRLCDIFGSQINIIHFK